MSSLAPFSHGINSSISAVIHPLAIRSNGFNVEPMSNAYHDVFHKLSSEQNPTKISGSVKAAGEQSAESDEEHLQPSSYLYTCSDVTGDLLKLDNSSYKNVYDPALLSFPGRSLDGSRKAVLLVDRIHPDGECEGYKATEDDTKKVCKEVFQPGGNIQSQYQAFDKRLPFKQRTWPACKWGYDNYDGYARNASAYPNCDFAAPEDTTTLLPINPDSFSCKTISPSATPTATGGTGFITVTPTPTSISAFNTTRPSIPSNTAYANNAPGLSSPFAFVRTLPKLKNPFSQSARAIGRAWDLRQ